MHCDSSFPRRSMSRRTDTTPVHAARQPGAARAQYLKRISNAMKSRDSGVLPASSQPEFPDQRVGCPAGDAHPSLVDAEEVMGGAEGDLVRVVVAAAL